MAGWGEIRRDLRDITFKFSGWSLVTSLEEERSIKTFLGQIEKFKYGLGNQWY